MKIKTIETNGITYIKPVTGATSEWYYGLDYEHGDLYEAEELFKDGHVVKGRKLWIVIICSCISVRLRFRDRAIMNWILFGRRR